MGTNVIASRIADFLKRFPPFEYLSKEEIFSLSADAVVMHFQAGDYVFRYNNQPSSYVYVVKEGLVHLIRDDAGVNVLADTCDEGDLFGVRAMLSGKPYVFDARCEEESIVYGIPIALFKPMTERHNAVAMFFAAGLAGGQAGILQAYEKVYATYHGTPPLLQWDRTVDRIARPLITHTPDTSIRNIAKVMSEKRIGSVVLCNEEGKAIGIVTDTDLRDKVCTGTVHLDAPVSTIMTSPVITMPLGQSLAAYLLTMLESNIRHICLTMDDQPMGMLSEKDLVAAHHNHPVTLTYALEEALTLETLIDLRKDADALIQFYLQQNVSTSLTSSLVTYVNDVLIKKIITLSIANLEKELGKPPLPFAWICLGSEGRSEQLIRTDQDNAIVYADAEGTETQKREIREHFHRLATLVNQGLEKAGFERCPANMMASNPVWCQPLSQWKSYFTEWIKTPEEKALMLSSIFFDYRIVYGANALTDELADHIKREIRGEKIFLHFLAKSALTNPPPLSFFKNLMVERSGEHINEFDIKARAMMPLADIARVLSLETGQLDNTNTPARFRRLAETDQARDELYRTAADAYEFLMRIRALKGLERNDSGRFIPIKELGKLDRQMLRNTFEPVKELQRMLELRYQLGYFGS